MKIKIDVSTNKIGSKCSRIIEIEDETIDEEISQIAEEIKDEMVSWDWYRV